MADEEVKVKVKIEENASKELDKIGDSFDHLEKKGKSAGEKLKEFGLAFVGVGAGLTVFAKNALEGAGRAEQLQIAFSTMIGDAKVAKETLASLTKFAATTPFQLPEVQEAAKKLLAFGTAAEDIEPTLRSLGDVSAGIGAPIAEIAELYGKAKVQGRLFSQDINQLTNRGIPIIGELAKQFGVSENKVKDLVESGKVGFPELEKAFKSMSSEGGQFGGLMEAQSKSFLGQISNIEDSIGQLTVAFGEALLPIATNVANFVGQITQYLSQMSPEMKAAIGEGIALAAAISGLVGAFMLLLSPIGAAGLAIAAIVTAYVLLKTHSTEILEFLKGWGIDFGKIWEGIKGAAMAAWDWINANIIPKVTQFINDMKALITPIVQFFQDNWDAITFTLQKAWDMITLLFGLFWEGFILVFSTSWEQFTGLLKAGLALIQLDFSGVWNAIKGMFIGVWNAMWGFLDGIMRRIVEYLGGNWEGIKKAISEFVDGVIGTWSSFWNTLFGIVNDIVGQITSAVNGLIKLIEGIIGKIADLIGAASKITGAVGGAIQGYGAGVIARATSGYIPPGQQRAKGGPVSSSEEYLVGENGPEIFRPNNSGTIIPNNKLGGSTIVFNFNGPVSSREVALEFADIALKELQLHSQVF